MEWPDPRDDTLFTRQYSIRLKDLPEENLSKQERKIFSENLLMSSPKEKKNIQEQKTKQSPAVNCGTNLKEEDCHKIQCHNILGGPSHNYDKMNQRMPLIDVK